MTTTLLDISNPMERLTVIDPPGPRPDALARLSRNFERRHPEAALQWATDTFAPYLALGTGFGPTGVVLMHLVSRIRPATTVFYLDTDLLFDETHDVREALADRLGLRFTRVHGGLSLEAQAREHGEALWERQPDRCCHLRKVRPLRRFLATQRAWIAGLRRDQSPARAGIDVVEWDAVNGLVKLNPLATWTSRDVWEHIRRHALPYNRLHDEGFPSVGCLPCTQPVGPGEDRRAGRWRGHGKTECGIHLQA